LSEDSNVEWGTEDWIKKLKEQANSSRDYRHKLYEKLTRSSMNPVNPSV